jgi:hypothetical protein
MGSENSSKSMKNLTATIEQPATEETIIDLPTKDKCDDTVTDNTSDDVSTEEKIVDLSIPKASDDCSVTNENGTGIFLFCL